MSLRVATDCEFNPFFGGGWVGFSEKPAGWFYFSETTHGLNRLFDCGFNLWVANSIRKLLYIRMGSTHELNLRIESLSSSTWFFWKNPRVDFLAMGSIRGY